MFHTGAWSQSTNPAGVLANINVVPDQAVFTSGADLRVPSQLPYVIGAAACINDASLARAELQSPSLRAMVNVDIEPLIQGKVFGSLPEQLIHPDTPIPVAANESLNMAMQWNAAAILTYGLVWLADGPQQPAKGSIYTVRGSGTAALVVSTWVNTGITFSQTLPYGTYQIVGMRARGTNLAAARLVFIGQAFRPGVTGVNVITNVDPYHFRWGNMGVFGQFDTTAPPTVDCAGDTDVAQIFEFDLIRVK